MHFTILMLRTGALTLSNCRLLRNGFVEIFKAAVKEAGIWLLEVRRQVGVIWAQTYLTPGCFWIAAFCRGLPSPRGLSVLWSKAGSQGHSCCVDLPCVLVKGINSLCLARLVFFCTSLQADSVTGKAVFLGCFPPCSKQPPVVVEMQLSPCQAIHCIMFSQTDLRASQRTIPLWRWLLSLARAPGFLGVINY